MYLLSRLKKEKSTRGTIDNVPAKYPKDVDDKIPGPFNIGHAYGIFLLFGFL